MQQLPVIQPLRVQPLNPREVDSYQVWESRWYIYQQIPAMNGIYKCCGFQSTEAEASSHTMAKHFPGAFVTKGYRGDRVKLTP